MELLKEIESVCPTCLKEIPAKLVKDEEGKVKIRKSCEEHGNFEDIYWGNFEHYKWVSNFKNDGSKVENPRTFREKGCPLDCGLCNEHLSHTVLGIIDITNRCNLKCPVCFSSANCSKRIYEPSKEKIAEMLKNLRNNKPIPSYAFQFSVVGNELALFRKGSEIFAGRIGEFVNKNLINPKKENEPISYEWDYVEGIDTLSLSSNGKVEFKPIKKVIKHKNFGHIYEVITENGFRAKLTGSHSIMVVTKKEGIIPKQVSKLNKDDYLILPKKLSWSNSSRKEINLIELFSEKKPEICDRLWVSLPKKELNYLVSKFKNCKERKLKWQIKKNSFPLSFLLNQGLNARRLKNSRIHLRGIKTSEINAAVKITPEFVRLLGYYSSEGCTYVYHSTKALSFTFGSHKTKLINDFLHCAEQSFGVKPSLNNKAPSSKAFRLGSLVSALFECLETGESASNKIVPSIIFNLPDSLIKEFVLTCFAGDRFFRERKTGAELSYKSISRELISGINLLLLKLSISHTLNYEVKNKRSKHPSYKIIISDKNEVNKLTGKKFKRNWEKASLFDRIPKDLLTPTKLDVYTEGTHYSWEWLSNWISLEHAKKFANPGTSVDKLLLNGEFFLQKVKEVKKINKHYRWVYDISVEGNETFFAGVGPILLHNSGGEPTLRDDLPELVKLGKELGFLYIMLDTNGIRIANDRKYLKQLKDNGVNALYLQFDGLDDNVYRKIRNTPLLNTKIRAIENCRKIGISVVLVVTLMKGINDSQIGGIIKFAIKNRDAITCVNFQPISFSGNASDLEVKENRITSYDFINLVEKQTNGKIKAKYFYPAPSTTPISKFIEAKLNQPCTSLSCHPCCGLGTYVVIHKNGDFTPINELIEVDNLFKDLDKSAHEIMNEGHISKKLGISILKTKARLLSRVMKNIHDSKRRDLILNVLKNGTFEAAASWHKNALMIGCMHFMDPWNFDVERVERCTIHYTTPDGRIIPFCSYNNFHRQEVENSFSVPLEEWQKMRK